MFSISYLFVLFAALLIDQAGNSFAPMRGAIGSASGSVNIGTGEV